MQFSIERYSALSPTEVRALIRTGEIDFPTAGLAAGYTQANLVVLPKQYADEFKQFAKLNPFSCPLLDIVEGSRESTMAKGSDIATDLPRYNIYRHGILTETLTDVSSLWQDDFVIFLIGCSFSFESKLLENGIEIRHITEGRNVPMYRTSINTTPNGHFSGPMVCSMRPMSLKDAERAAEITAQMPYVHGAPVHIGTGEDIGITDLSKPDYGDAVTVKDGEVCVFWPCGVTPQAALLGAKFPLVITHAPGHMFIGDIKNDELEGYIKGTV